jgi:hypothetical protein
MQKPPAARIIGASVSLSILLAGALAGIVGLRSKPTRNFDHEQFERIQLGMTETEVVDILGVEPGQYSSGLVVVHTPSGPFDRASANFG